MEEGLLVVKRHHSNPVGLMLLHLGVTGVELPAFRVIGDAVVANTTPPLFKSSILTDSAAVEMFTTVHTVQLCPKSTQTGEVASTAALTLGAAVIAATASSANEKRLFFVEIIHHSPERLFKHSNPNLNFLIFCLR
jgi:hypothetical protein